MAPKETDNTSLALKFAKAVSGGDAKWAHGMLSAALRSALTPQKLEAEYKTMISYGSGAPTIIAVMTTMDWWPDKFGGGRGRRVEGAVRVGHPVGRMGTAVRASEVPEDASHWCDTRRTFPEGDGIVAPGSFSIQRCHE